MGMRPADTSPEAMKVWIEALRRLPPGRKVEYVFELIDFHASLAMKAIERDNPGISEYGSWRRGGMGGS